MQFLIRYQYGTVTMFPARAVSRTVTEENNTNHNQTWCVKTREKMVFKPIVGSDYYSMRKYQFGRKYNISLYSCQN